MRTGESELCFVGQTIEFVEIICADLIRQRLRSLVQVFTFPVFWCAFSMHGFVNEAVLDMVILFYPILYPCKVIAATYIQ